MAGSVDAGLPQRGDGVTRDALCVLHRFRGVAETEPVLGLGQRRHDDQYGQILVGRVGQRAPQRVRRESRCRDQQHAVEDHAAAAEEDAALGRRPGQELGELGADPSLVEVDALDRIAGERRRGPRQPADEPARWIGFPRGGGKRRGERAVEEGHTERVRDALGHEVSRRAVLGGDGHDGRVGQRGCLPWSYPHPGTSAAPPKAAPSGS